MSARRTRPRVMLPVRARRGLLAGAVLLVAVAAAGNIGHTYDHVNKLAPPGMRDGWMVSVTAVLPDILLILSVTRLRFDRRSIRGWIGAAAATAFVGWSCLSESGDTPWAWVAVGYPLAVAVIAASLMEGDDGEPLEVLLAHLEALADDADRTAELTARAVSEAADAAVARAHTDAQDAVRAAAEDAAQARAEASALGARVTELDAALAAARTAHADASAPSADGTPDPSADAARTASGRRRKGARPDARRPSGKTTQGADDVQRRRTAKDGYMASVRAGDPWPNERLACVLSGCTDACSGDVHKPGPDARVNARKRASEWRAAVAREDGSDAAADDHQGAVRTAVGADT